jgi:hypothetical protein
MEWKAGESLFDYYVRIYSPRFPADSQWSDGEIELMKSRKCEPFVFNRMPSHLENNHEKPTANPYATYLCIDNNSK